MAVMNHYILFFLPCYVAKFFPEATDPCQHDIPVEDNTPQSQGGGGLRGAGDLVPGAGPRPPRPRRRQPRDPRHRQDTVRGAAAECRQCRIHRQTFLLVLE